MNGAHVEVRDLTIVAPRRDDEPAVIVDKIGFALPKGEVLALIGESGSGKTTLALSLMGYTKRGLVRQTGKIRLGDTQVDQLDESALAELRGRRVTYIAQSAASAFNPSRKVMAQVIEPLQIHGLAGRKEAEEKAVDLFRALALPDPETIGNRYPHQVSGGQLQRLMAAMALITDPELVILDEPTTALDVTTQVEVLKTFKTAIARSGASAIYVSHDLAVVAQMADRILVLKGGVMQEEGAAEDILARPRSEYTRTLMAAAHPALRQPAQTASQRPVLEVSGLTAGYGRVTDGVPAIPVVQDVGFTLSRGSALGVIGESGSGKSTLARAIAGLLPRASGSVRLDGEELPPALDRRTRDQLRRVQIVFQNADTALNPAHTVGETLARPLQFYFGLKGEAAATRVLQLLDLIRLPQAMATQRSRHLSGGQKQRLNLARALAAEPDVLLCDEVTSALDTVVGEAILTLIDDLRRDLGIATVFISHDISRVRAFCDRLLVLYAGRSVEQADREAFDRGGHHPYTQLLLSSVPEMDPTWLDRAPAQPAGNPQFATSGDKLCSFLHRCPSAIGGLCDAAPPPTQAGPPEILCHLGPARGLLIGEKVGIDA
jgi:peptide/nickel transport system ATP-binding protein